MCGEKSTSSGGLRDFFESLGNNLREFLFFRPLMMLNLSEKWLYKARLLASFRAPVVIASGFI
jgi:hypothetical protein